MSSGSSGGSSMFGGIVLLAVIVIGVVVALFAITFASTGVQEIGLHYTGGPIEGQKFVNVIPPGRPLRPVGLADDVYKLPVNQRTYTISQNPKASDSGQSDSITALNADGNEVIYETAMNFEVNTNAEVASDFFENVCTKYDNCEGYDDGDFDVAGWDGMLQDYLRRAQESTLQSVSRQMSTDTLAKGDTALPEINRRVNDALPEAVNGFMGGPYFKDIEFQVSDLDLPPGIVERYNQLEEAKIETERSKQQVFQAKQQANAAEELQSASRDNPGYIELRRLDVLEKCVENDSCQVWLVPEGSGTNLSINP